MNSSLAVAAFGSQQRASLWAGRAPAGLLEGRRPGDGHYSTHTTGRTRAPCWSYWAVFTVYMAEGS